MNTPKKTPLTLNETLVKALKAIDANLVYRITNIEVGTSSYAYTKYVKSIKQLFAAGLVGHIGACRQDYFLTPAGKEALINYITKKESETEHE